MPVYLLIEHDNAKDKVRFNKYRKWVVDEWVPYLTKIMEEGICESTALSDNTGHIIGILKFEDLDAFGKLWNDDKFHSLMMKYVQLVDNVKIRFCRPAKVIAPEEVA